jgi:hypothetical protein
MNLHAREDDPDRDTQNLICDLDEPFCEDTEQLVDPSRWRMISLPEMDGQMVAFYIFLLLFLLALARAVFS